MPHYKTADAVFYHDMKQLKQKLTLYPTNAESILWQELRSKKLGQKFRRQHVIGKFIVDFICLSKQVIVEVDGNVHQETQEYDEFRTQYLNSLGFSVTRFSNEEVMNDLETVLRTIQKLVA